MLTKQISTQSRWQSTVRLAVKYILRSLQCFLVALALYGAGVMIGALIPVNANYTPPQQGITVFVTTNGFHTDVVLPVQERRDACFGVLLTDTFAQSYADCQYISFGWGDRDFYMASYNNAFPSAGTVADALLLPSETLMHVYFCNRVPKAGKHVKAITLTPTQYENLVQFVTASFHRKDQALVKLNQPGYGPDDYFFEAEGNYHLFRTCNVWTGEALQAASVKVSRWTPLAHSVFFHLP